MFREYRKVAVIPLIEHGQFSIDYLLFWLDWGCCLRIIRIVCTVKLGIKELFDKEQIGIKEPFPVTNLPFIS